MHPHATPGAEVQEIENGWRLSIPAGDSSHYRDAQLDDYAGLPRSRFPHQAIKLSLRARASSRDLPGTWGFGLWNDPFGLSIGFGVGRFRLPCLPNAAWFFHASRQNHLSFSNDQPASGFLAQAFNAPRYHPGLIPAGLALPFSSKASRNLLSKMVAENAVSVDVNVIDWHEYKIEWKPGRTEYWVDQVQVFESDVSPRPLLGLVIWIDNQFAAFPPTGKIRFGVLENPEPAWIEITHLRIDQMTPGQN